MTCNIYLLLETKLTA